MLILTREQVREVDRRAVAEYGMSGLVLMENAGRGVADVLCGLVWEPSPGGRGQGEGAELAPLADTLTPTLSQGAREPVVIVCGKGNNGGDGFVIARHLDLRGLRVRAMLLAEPKELRGDAAANFGIIEKAGLAIEVFNAPLDVAKFKQALGGSFLLIDAILGTGATGEPKSPYAEAIELMNESGIKIVAVDLPSGLDCDTGVAARHTIRAAHTCTFVAAKPGLMVARAAEYVGHLHVCDIGVPRKLIEEISTEIHD
jgi:NAD(P)H-hydrate epimerase